jgi:hypothetical protein
MSQVTRDRQQFNFTVPRGQLLPLATCRDPRGLTIALY